MNKKRIKLSLIFFLLLISFINANEIENIYLNNINSESVYNNLYTEYLYTPINYYSSIITEENKIYDSTDSYIYKPVDYNESIIAGENSIYKSTDLNVTLKGSYAISQQNVKKKSIIASYSPSEINSFISSTRSSYVGVGNTFTVSQNQSEFINQFMEWQNEYISHDFWEDANAQENYIKSLYSSAAKKFGIGASIVVIPYIISLVVPDGGTIAIVSSIIFKNSYKFAFSGMIEEIIRSTIVGLMQNKDSDCIIAEAVNAGSDGFLIGAILGTLKGFSKIIGLEPKTNQLLVNRNGRLFDNKGNEIGKLIKSSDKKPLYYKLYKDNKLLSLAGDRIDNVIYNTNAKEAVYYTSNGLLKSIDNGTEIGKIIIKDNIRFIFNGDNARPIAAINPQNILVTNNTLKNAGISNASISTIFSEFADPRASNYYRALYIFNNPTVKISKGDVIHHSIEKQVLDRYPDAFTEYEILRDPSTFRGIPKSENNYVHLSQIRNIWDNTYDNINDTLYENQSIWNNEQQKEYIRKSIFETRDNIDQLFSNVFIENK